MHRLVPLTFYMQGQADADGVILFDVPVGMTIIGASLCVEAYTGSGSTCNVVIQDDGTDAITALTADTAGTAGTWLTPALGGSETPVHLAAGSDVEVDVNLDSDTVDATLVLYVTLDEV